MNHTDDISFIVIGGNEDASLCWIKKSELLSFENFDSDYFLKNRVVAKGEAVEEFLEKYGDL